MFLNGKAEAAAGRINSVLESFMPVLTPGGLALGLLFPSFFIRLRPFIPLIFGLMTLSGAIKMKAREMTLVFCRPLPIVFFFLFSRIITPLGVFFLGRIIFGGDSGIIAGFVLIYAVPTAVSGFIWVSIFRGNYALTLSFILLDTLLAPVVVPGTIRILLGTTVSLDTTGMILSLMYMVAIPTIAGVILNEASGGNASRVAAPYLAPIAKICMVIVISANTAAAASLFDFRSLRFWIVAAAGVGFSVFGFAAGRIAGALGRFDRETGVSLFFGVGLHNISAAMTLGIEFFPASAALPSIVGIMFQQTISALMGKLAYNRSAYNQQPRRKQRDTGG